MNMDMATDKVLRYLLKSYKDDLHHYENEIERYTFYAKNAKRNIAEIEKELEQRDVEDECR